MLKFKLGCYKFTSRSPWKSIPWNTPGENNNDICALADLSICVNKYQQAFWCRCRGTGSCSRIEPSHLCILFHFTTTTFTSPHPSTTTHHMDSTPIHQFSTPKGEFLEPPQSSWLYSHVSGPILLWARR